MTGQRKMLVNTRFKHTERLQISKDEKGFGIGLKEE
jgi:hypothetical protein